VVDRVQHVGLPHPVVPDKAVETRGTLDGGLPDVLVVDYFQTLDDHSRVFYLREDSNYEL
jgi:hypothetical protein